MALIIIFIILENLTLLIFAIEALIKNKKRKENEFIFDPICRPLLSELSELLNNMEWSNINFIYQGQDYGYFDALNIRFKGENSEVFAKFMEENSQLKVIKILLQEDDIIIYVTGQGNKNSKD